MVKNKEDTLNYHSPLFKAQTPPVDFLRKSNKIKLQVHKIASMFKPAVSRLITQLSLVISITYKVTIILFLAPKLREPTGNGLDTAQGSSETCHHWFKYGVPRLP